MSPTTSAKAEAFRALHVGPPFLIPNPWDVGSARVLEALGFPALATTSSGFAFTLGRLDGRATLDEVVEQVGAIDAATGIPVSVDLENGYGAEPEAAAHAVSRVAAAAERVAAAVEAARALDRPFVLSARAENHIRGNPDLGDTIVRLQAYEQAGADVLYAPGLRTAEEIRAVCGAVSRPVNVLAVSRLSTAEIFEAGAQRISVGGSLTWVAVKAMADAAVAMRDGGDLSALATRVPLGDWLSS